MKKSITILLVILMIGLFIAALNGCGGSDSTTTTTTASGGSGSTTTTSGSSPTTTLTSSAYCPLANGYSRSYQSSLGTSQIETVEGTVSLWTRSYSIVNVVSISSGGSVSGTGEALFRVADDELFQGSRSSSLEITYLEFPLTVGNSWVAYDSGISTVDASIISNSNVTVNAGTFNCYKVRYINRYSGTVSTGEIWYGANAGKIKTISESVTFELQSKNF